MTLANLFVYLNRHGEAGGAPDVDAFADAVLALGNKGDGVEITYRGLNGLAGTFTPPTIEYLLRHDDVHWVYADCNMGPPPRDMEEEENAAKNAAKSHTVREKAATWGLNRINKDSAPAAGGMAPRQGITGGVQAVQIFVVDTGVRGSYELGHKRTIPSTCHTADDADRLLTPSCAQAFSISRSRRFGLHLHRRPKPRLRPQRGWVRLRGSFAKLPNNFRLSCQQSFERKMAEAHSHKWRMGILTRQCNVSSSARPLRRSRRPT